MTLAQSHEDARVCLGVSPEKVGSLVEAVDRGARRCVASDRSNRGLQSVELNDEREELLVLFVAYSARLRNALICST